MCEGRVPAEEGEGARAEEEAGPFAERMPKKAS